MDYATALQVFFQPAPEGTPIPEPTLDASPARRLRDAIEPLAMHWAWAPLVNERLAARGLNFLTGYVWGRAAPMGEPIGALVASTFAAFEPGLIASLYDEGRVALGRDDLLHIQGEATTESLRGVLGDADVAFAATALRRAVEAVDATGRPLFAGVRSLGWSDDPLAQLWRACQAAREYRGDGHIAAYVAAGLDPVQMNILTELWNGYPLGTYSATRAWSGEQTDAALAALRSAGYLDGDTLSEQGREARRAIEERTDALARPLVAALGADLDTILPQLARWGEACIAAGAFPPDPRKRAAG